ncbi:MAG TPA: anti-sigma factor [Candidatus Elarobacter sp.]
MNPHDDLEAYVLGALDPADAAAFESHLSGCAECRDGVASYGGVMRALRSVAVPSPPPAPRVGRARAAQPAWIAALAAAAAAIVVGAAVAQHNAATAGDDDVALIAQLIADRPYQVALAGPSARGAAIVGSGGTRTAFVVSGLPAPPAGRGYQVWVRGAGIRSPGMMHRTSTGLEVLVVRGDALAGAKHIGITVEPAGGSPKRTGPPQVTGDVS